MWHKYIEEKSQGFVLLREVSFVTDKEIPSLWNIDQTVIDAAIYLKSIENRKQNTSIDQILEKTLKAQEECVLAKIMTTLICYKTQYKEEEIMNKF